MSGIQYLITISFILTSCTWLAANIGLLWYAHCIKKTQSCLFTQIFFVSACVSTLFATCFTFLELTVTGASLSEKFYLALEKHYELLIDLINWSYLLSIVTWAVVGGVFLILAAQKKKQFLTISPTPSDETSGART